MRDLQRHRNGVRRSELLFGGLLAVIRGQREHGLGEFPDEIGSGHGVESAAEKHNRTLHVDGRPLSDPSIDG